MSRGAHLGIIVLLLLGGLPSEAQDLGTKDRLRFQHLTTANGLRDNSVTCLLEDRSGYIWIGTEHGLDRYDGQRVRRYTGSSAPAGMRISSIAQDSSGTIWVSSSDGGLSRYDHTTDRFSAFMQAQGSDQALPTDRLNHLLALNDSILVISTQNGGLLWCNTKEKSYRQRSYDPFRLSENDTTGYWCHSTALIDRDRIWLGLIPGGNSYILDARSGKVLHDIRSVNADSLHSLTNAIVYDRTILAGGWGPGITRLHLDELAHQEYSPLEDEITAILPWTDGTLLASTKINGLLVLDPQLRIVRKDKHRRYDPTSIGDNQVRCLIKDRQGNIWAGTASGISVHAPSVWPMRVNELFPDPAHEQPGLTFHNLQQHPDGLIRISTSHGFFTLKHPQAAVKHIPVLDPNGRSLELTGLFHTGPNEYFAGSETGLFPYDPSRERLGHLPEHWQPSPYPMISMYQVRSAFADTIAGVRRILVGALGFSFRVLDPVTVEYEKKGFTLVMDPGLVLTDRTTFDSSTGRYWSGTTKGIYLWAPPGITAVDTPLTFLKRSPPERRLPGEDVSAIAIRNGIAWATMREGFLAMIDNGKVKAYRVPKHMPPDLQGLAFDERGRLWCPTSDGLVRFDPRDGSWLHVPVNDGRRFRQLNGSILLLHDGTMALCADNSLITFDPAAFDRLPVLPEPRLTSIRNSWGDISLIDSDHLELPYSASSFEAHISALWPTGPAHLQFLYRLEGVEQLSHVATANAAIRYAGVPIGEHRLLVRVRDAYGREGPEFAVLTLSIAAPLWQRWWVYVLLALLAGLAVYAGLHYRLQRTKELQAMRDGIARDLHDDIGSTLGSISYYSEALKRRLGGEDPVAQEVADKIGTNSRDLISRMSDIVWSVDPKHDSAGSLSQRMKSYASDLLAARSVALEFTAGPRLNARHLSTPVRRGLFLIFKEALHNAMKYSSCTKMEISLHYDGKIIRMTIADNGSGFEPSTVDSYNGNGLPSIRARAESLGGKAEINSSPGSGTIIHVWVAPEDGIPLSGD